MSDDEENGTNANTVVDSIINNIKKLKIRRGQLKSVLTRFKTYFDSPNLSITTLKLRLSNLETAWREFESVQSALEELDPAQEPERESFEDEYYNYASLAVERIEQYDRNLLQSQTANANINTNVPQSNQSFTSNNIKLQSISLPQFSGSYECWLQFFETFQALVDRNRDLSKIQKFYYLKSCLCGDATQVLQSLEICESNYDIAIQLLRERYENKRLLIHNHTRNLFEIQPITKESHLALRKLVDNVLRNTRALEGLGQPVDQWDTLLIYLISQKLDNHTRKEWETFNKDDSPKFHDFLKFLKNKCQVLETIFTKTQNVVESSIEIRPPRTPRNSLNNLNATDTVNPSFNSIPVNVYCSVCKEKSHFTYKCPKLLQLQIKDRFSELKRLGICTNCLRNGHKADVCTGKCCKVCNRKHNSSLHDYNFHNKQNSSTFTAITRTHENNHENPQNHINDISTHSSQTDNTALQGTTTSTSSVTAGASTSRAQPLESREDTTNENERPILNACSYEPRVQSIPVAENAFTASKVETQLNEYQILLATAVVYVLDRDNKPVKCRALLDSASQSNFCSENLYSKLKIHSNKINIPIFGINNTSSKVTNKIKTSIKSLNNTFQKTIDLLVIDKITSNLPQISFDSCLIQIPENIELADPEFAQSEQIDLLIGTEIFFDCLNIGKISFGKNAPILQNTKFGWVLVGPFHFNKMHNFQKQNCFLTTSEIDQTLHDTVKKFWQLEHIKENSENKLTNEELECELHFRNNYKILNDRFVVQLPLKANYTNLGESYYTALKCLNSLNRRLDKNFELRKAYTEFLREYEELGHMSRVNPDLDKTNEIYVYLSHHAVVKETSSTTKVRVVFNASQKTDSGISLNDVLKIGPKVQKDVFDIVLQMRTYPILIVGDIEKMYRMILIDEAQRNFQRILWRDTETNSLIHYQLNTITYGTSSASFLATRVLHEIGIKHKDSNPDVSQIIINNFYMDDLIFGHHDIDKAVKLKSEVEEILLKYGLNLRKWTSNDNTPYNKFYIRDETETKTLGTFWNPYNDTIGYHFKLRFDISKITKRTILAVIGQLFDILGLISPIIVRAKLILQQVWKMKVDWDTEVPENIANEWLDFLGNLDSLNQLQIPRCILRVENNYFMLCGFCDASLSAYGACVYLVYRKNSKEIESNLICSKSRIAPLNTSTLARLELCGALLLAQLVKRVINSLHIRTEDIVLFSDATIVLDWLSSEPSKWKIFVSNRIAEIQRLTENMVWRHVEAEYNPADIVSRGSDPKDLQNQSLWWHGPSFLKTERDFWPESQKSKKITVHEVRKEIINLSFVNVKRNSDIDIEILSKFSSYTKLVRVLAYIYRFVHNISQKEKLSGSLSSHELDDAVLKICKLIQIQCFTAELKCLKTNQKLFKQSRLISLNPFLDNYQIIRVGGRLDNSNLPFERKHPVILPSNHRFVELLIDYYHRKFLHAGSQFILNQIREKFWIINGRNGVKKVLRRCITCFRTKPLSINQLMGSLPTPRVVPSRPFSHCGIYYAGPFYIKDGKTRNRVLIKAYVCIFICFSSRAVHAELVTELSSEAFLNAFKRFVSRRGLSSNIFSDNGTNFVGAYHELQRLCQVVQDTVNSKYQNYFSEHKIKWHFIPARSPHHGGIWESAVRSFKFHLKRVLGDNHLNFEQFYTLLTQIEAILNSRPILPLTNDPSDLEVLTPGHFIIGESLVAVPQSNDVNICTNRLRYYKELQQIVQRFWLVWSQDYLNSLQQRSKWRFKEENIKLDTLVLLKEDNTPPMHWPLGRVVCLHPGIDNHVRVVSVQTKNGVVKRAITKICPLPIDNDPQNEFI